MARTVSSRLYARQWRASGRRGAIGTPVLLALAGVALLAMTVVAVAEDGGDGGSTAPDAAGADGAAAAGEADEMPDFSKMRVKALKALLDERGVKCVGCVEKTDFVERAKETYHMPIKAKAAPGGSGSARKGDAAPNFDYDSVMEQFRKQQEQNEKLKEQLKAQGLNVDGMNFGGGFGGMDPDVLANAMKGAGAAKKQKPSKPKVDEGDVDEVIEL